MQQLGCMIQQQKLRVTTLQQGYLFEVQKYEENAMITVMDYRNQQDIKKFARCIKFQDTQSQDCYIKYFDSCEELIRFLSEKENFQISFQQGKTTICLVWKFGGKSFQKLKSTKIQLQQFPINQNQSLRTMNRILKMKLIRKNTVTASKINNEDINQKQKENKPSSDATKKIYVKIKPEKFQNEIQEQKQRKTNIVTKLPNDNLISLIQDQSSIKIDKPARKYQPIKRKRPAMGKCILKEDQNEQKTKLIFKQRQNQNKHSKEGSTNRHKLHLIKNRARKTLTKTPKQKQLDQQIQPHTITKIDEDTYRVDFQNGDYYTGQMKNKLYNGKGFYFSAKNGTFEGTWKNGKAHGFGVCIDQNGNKLSGVYKQDKRYGQGIDQYANGQRYQGNFQGQTKCGRGKYFSNDGTYFDGYWQDDSANGKGKEVYPDKSYFIGCWKNDQQDGKGIFCKNGRYLLQNWKMGSLVSQKQITRQQKQQFQAKFDFK